MIIDRPMISISPRADRGVNAELEHFLDSIVQRLRQCSLFPIFVLEVVSFQIISLPSSMRFDFVAFQDTGANFTFQYLLSQGLKPSIDFGYNYGLLPLMVGRLWFGAFGSTPVTLQLLMLTCNLLVAEALARTVKALDIGLIGKSFLVLSLGYYVVPSYPNIAHALEAVMITEALALHARGSLGGALAMSIVAAFMKPAMGYIYSILLVIEIVCDSQREGLGYRGLARRFVLPLIVGATLSLLLVANFGPLLLVRTLLPFSGIANYRAMDMGFFGIGRQFWLPHGANVFYYLGTFAGLFIVGTLFLVVSAASGVRRLWTRQTDQDYARTLLICVCLLLQLAFILLLFGNAWSWFLYSCFLLLGIAAAASLGPTFRSFVMVCCLLSILGYKATMSDLLRRWRSEVRPPLVSSLWTTNDEASEWEKVLVQARLHPPAVVVSPNESVGLMFPELEKPVGAFFLPGMIPAREMQRKRQQIAGAHTIVVPMPNVSVTPVNCFQTLVDQNFTILWKGRFFEVFRRRSAK